MSKRAWLSLGILIAAGWVGLLSSSHAGANGINTTAYLPITLLDSSDPRPPTSTPEATATIPISPTGTNTSTPTPTLTPTSLPTTTEEPTVTATQTLSPTSTPTSTATPSPTATTTTTPTRTPTTTPTKTPTATSTPKPTATPTKDPSKCHPSYPTVCIPPPPPDLNCDDIPYRNFTVLPPDPHRFDSDKDGIGCESN